MESLRCFADEMPRISSLLGLQVWYYAYAMLPEKRGREKKMEDNAAPILALCFFSGWILIQLCLI